jgi:hypothetical protein
LVEEIEPLLNQKMKTAQIYSHNFTEGSIGFLQRLGPQNRLNIREPIL